MPEAVEISSTGAPLIPTGLKLILPSDTAAHIALAGRIANVPIFWTDPNRLAPALWYAQQWMSPQNMVFDVDEGNGVMAFLYAQAGWRAQVYAARWDGGEGGVYDTLAHMAMQAAFLGLNLLVLDAFVRVDNDPANKACIRMGMRNRGVIQHCVSYNGDMKDVNWYEISREEMLAT